MTDSRHLADQSWKQAEALVERTEQAARAGLLPSLFFDQVTEDLRRTTGATAAAMWFENLAGRTMLSRCGVSLHVEEELADGTVDLLDHASRSRWVVGHSPVSGRLVTRQRVDDEFQLGLDLHFDRAPEIASHAALGELAEVVLDLSATVWLRSRLGELRRAVATQADRDGWISRLYEGLTPQESFAAIAAAVAPPCQADRVSLLFWKSGRPRLLAASTQPSIDRRSRQARLLERLADATALAQGGAFHFTVGSPGPVSADVLLWLDRYLHDSGCCDIYIETFPVTESGAERAAVVLERFRIPSGEQPSLSAALEPIRGPLGLAIRRAMARRDASWRALAERLASPGSRPRGLVVTAGLCALVLAACFVPTPLKIPVEGRIVAAHRSHLFAPAEGIVAEIDVANGQQVWRGDTLVVLHSPSLDLQQREVQAVLSTAQTRLNSLLALRSRSGGSPNRRQEVSDSADEQVLKEEIAGLDEQLRLLRSQQADLTITSPIDGRVDKWDLQQSLAGRPVRYGQHLLDVISDDGCWTVELDLPEKNVNYVLAQQRNQTCPCTFRLRSNPQATHHAAVGQIADVAQLDPLGQSIVKVAVPLRATTSDGFRSGATVIAQLHCGTRPLGFVWLRGLIEWYRSQAWF
jgi:hypothetical protein